MNQFPHGAALAAPVASVVVPAFNHRAFVAEAVHSALACVGVPLEVIVVDDGSTDGTAEVVAAITDPRLTLLRQDNCGAHLAFARGIARARGEFLLLLNSDDVFAPTRIERCCAILRDHPEVSLVGSWLELIDDGGRHLGIKHAWQDLPPWPPERPGDRLSDLGDPRLALLESNYLATTSNAAFRRALFGERGLEPLALRYAHDWELFLAAAGRGQVHLIEEPLVRYRIHATNTLRETAEGGNDTTTAGRGQDQEQARGQGAMRFEILWLLARHAAPVLERHLHDLTPGPDGHHRPPDQNLARDLERRLWNSLPRFGHPEILAQLLWLRGAGEQPSAAFDALLTPTHPLRRAAVAALAAS